MFGTDRLDAVLLNVHCRPPAASYLEPVLAAVGESTAHGSPVDDQTLIALQHL